MFTSRSISLSAKQYLILVSSSMGQILGAALSAVVGVVLPLLRTNPDISVSSAELSCIGASALIGITAGSALIGKVSTRFAPLIFLKLGPLITTSAALFTCFSESIPALCAALTVIGFTVGGEYSLDSDTVSKYINQKQRAFMVGVVKASSALGSIFGALAVFLLLKKLPLPETVNLLFLVIAVPAFFTFLLRLFITDKVLRHPIQTAEISHPPLWKGNGIERIVFCGIPWACEGASVYGVGIFLPTLLMALIPDEVTAVGAERILDSAGLSVLVSSFMLPGFLIGLFLIGKLSPLRLQAGGFLIAATGLFILFISARFRLPLSVCLIGFLVFELALNAGPHLMTYVMPGEVYPSYERSEGAGLAAAVGKLGAAASVISIPFLIEKGGAQSVLLISAILLLIGAVVTEIFGRKLLGRKVSEPGDKDE